MKPRFDKTRTRLAGGLIATGIALCSAMQARAGAYATAPPRITVSIPHAARSARVVMLELSILPTRNSVRAVVRLGTVEIGHLTVMASGAEQRYQFNIGSIVQLFDMAGGNANVEVAVTERLGRASSEGSLLVRDARIVTR